MLINLIQPTSWHQMKTSQSLSDIQWLVVMISALFLSLLLISTLCFIVSLWIIICWVDDHHFVVGSFFSCFSQMIWFISRAQFNCGFVRSRWWDLSAEPRFFSSQVPWPSCEVWVGEPDSSLFQAGGGDLTFVKRSQGGWSKHYHNVTARCIIIVFSKEGLNQVLITRGQIHTWKDPRLAALSICGLIKVKFCSRHK